MISIVIATASVVIASLAVYVPWKNQQDKDLFREAVLSLERAYNSLSNDGKNLNPPLVDRLNWLTSARHIHSYKLLKAKIKSKFYRSLCEEHEEYWRHQFYLCLGDIGLSNYYENAPSPIGRLSGGPIEPRSALVVHAFASWPKKRSDPILSLKIASITSESNVLQEYSGLADYLEKFPKIMGKKTD